MLRSLPSTTKPLTIVAACAALILSYAADTSAINIFDGTRKIVLWFHDSVTGGKNLKPRVDRYLKEQGIDPTSVIIQEWPGQRYTGLAYDGTNYFPCVAMSGTCNSWIRDLKATMATARTVSDCPDCPVVLIAQSGTGRHFLNDTLDDLHARMTCEELEYMVQLARDSGVAEIFISTYMFAWHHQKLEENLGPAIRLFNERNLGKTPPIIDCMTPTYQEWPNAQANDMYHGDGYADDYMSHRWFKALLEHDGRTVPAWSDSMLSVVRQGELDRRAKGELLSPLSGAYKLGDTIKVKWTTDHQFFFGISSGWKWKVGMNIRITDQRRTNDIMYGMLSLWGANGLAYDTDSLSIVVDQAMINTIKSKLYKGEAYEGAVPVLLHVGLDKPHGSPWWGSTVDFANPSRMILIYPNGVIDPSLPVYPSGFAGQPILSTRLAQSRPAVTRYVSGGPAARMFDIRGRKLPLHSGSNRAMPWARAGAVVIRQESLKATAHVGLY